MSSSRIVSWCLGVSLFVLGAYAALSLALPRDSQSLTTFGDLVQCIVPLFANAGLLLNAGTPRWGRNFFWMLMALGCTMWMVGQFGWTYYEVYLHKPVPDLFPGDIIYFLRGIPMMAALTLRPHHLRRDSHLRFGYLDFVLLLAFWLFLYAYGVLPWMYAEPLVARYSYGFNVVTNIQNLIIVGGLGVFALRTHGSWRLVYANLFGAATCYMLAALAINVAIGPGQYYTGSFYDLPLITSMLWFGLAGVIAYVNRAKLEAPSEQELTSGSETSPRENIWPARLAMLAVISLPFFAIYTLRFSQDSLAVRDFRLMTALIAAVPLALLIFIRTHLADSDRSRLLAQSEQSIENLQRVQDQMVQTEKLVSLGQLAAGAAHEINNPLTAILGFSDLLADNASLPENARGLASKIRDQARRTKALVSNLLSFARQVPPERTLLDINTVVTNAVQLRALDLRSGTTRVDLHLESVLPGVRGDGNQLMQVFFNIVKNAIDALSGVADGVLSIKTMRDRSNVVVLFSDNGPGIKEPSRVFDPFYTTKPVGKGTGLGLSICFGIVQEHGGKILCYNRQEGGAVFRVELPAALAASPSRELTFATPPTGTPKPS